MHQSKLVKAVSMLSAWELRHLHDFMHSPFCNKHQRVTDLFDLLIDHAPDFPAEALDRRRVYARIFANGPFHEQKFKDLLSLAMKTFRSFLAFYRLRNDEFSTGFALLEALRDRGWDAEFRKAEKQARKELEKSLEKRHEVERKRLQLQEARIEFLSARRDRKVEDSLQVCADQLDTYYILAKLKYGVEMANRQNVVSQDFDFGLLDDVLRHLGANEALLERHPEIRIYYLIYACLTRKAPGPAFDKLKSMLRTDAHRFPRSERHELYAYALNFCIQQVNKGRRHYLRTLLDLYRWALEDETLMTDGWLSHWDYKNIVSASLKAREFEWCKTFIERYKPKVEPESRENAYTYNLASLWFEQREYGKALRLLQHVEFRDVFYHLGAKVILLRSFYELDDYEALISLCDTFKVYLKRNKTLSEYHYTVNWNLVTFTRKLADLRRKLPYMDAAEGRKKLEKLKHSVKEKRNVAQLSWLMEKVEALEEERKIAG